MLAESPWTEELRLGKPLVGVSGSVFNKWLRRLSIDRNSLLITNSINCKIPHLGWIDARKNESAVALAHCSRYLDETIGAVQPKVIVTLGGVALQRATGQSDVTARHAYVEQSGWGVPVVPTFHPSYIQRGQHKLTPAVLFAFRRAQQVAAANGRWERSATNYLLDPPIEQLEAYVAQWQGEPLAFDIETPYSTALVEDETEEDISYEIVRVSFSWRSGEGVSVPWASPYIELCKRLLARSQETIFWNQGFDVPRLKAQGITFGGRIVDGMWAWHWLQSDLPKSLGFVAPFYSDLAAWKHLSDSQPAYYSAVDADATIRCYAGIKRDIQAEGRWGQFERHCIQTLPVLEAMGQRGLVVDGGAQMAFKQRLEAELLQAKESLQAAVPPEVKPLHVYKGVPKAARDHFKVLGEDIKGAVIAEFEQDGSTFRLQDGVWTRRDPFNPDSPKQVLALIKHLGLQVPVNRKTGGDSTGAKYLQRFSKKHEVFKWILECRSRADMLGTFIWPIRPDGRVGTSYGFHPSTWRKSSRAVNLQNIPKRNDLAKDFRKTLVASPGCVLVEADSAAIEAVLVGYAAGDPDYIRLAKLGIHDFLTSHMIHQPASVEWSDDKLAEYLRQMKKEHKVEREAAKRVIHGSNYGLSPYGMHDEYQEYFPKVRDAEQLQSLYFTLFPSIRKWHASTLQRAHKEGFLDNHFGYRHYFWHALKWDGESQGYVYGDDAKRAIAFVPQSDASAIQTEYVLKLNADPEVRDYLRLIIHDSCVMEVPQERVDQVCQRVYDVFTAPIPQLGGLSIGAEVQVGPSLGAMKVWEPKVVMV